MTAILCRAGEADGATRFRLIGSTPTDCSTARPPTYRRCSIAKRGADAVQVGRGLRRDHAPS